MREWDVKSTIRVAAEVLARSAAIFVALFLAWMVGFVVWYRVNPLLFLTTGFEFVELFSLGSAGLWLPALILGHHETVRGDE